MTDTTPIPTTLNPIKRGAVVDWKATAVRDHLALVAASTKALNTGSLFEAMQQEILKLGRAVVEAEAQRNLAHSHLRLIRAHWSAFLLPRAHR